MDWNKMILDIAKVGAQNYTMPAEPVPCEDCEAPATESWAIPIPPFAEHFCQRCADKRRDRAYEQPHHDLPRAEND
jgi:hypothetical protein